MMTAVLERPREPGWRVEARPDVPRPARTLGAEDVFRDLSLMAQPFVYYDLALLGLRGSEGRPRWVSGDGAAGAESIPVLDELSLFDSGAAGVVTLATNAAGLRSGIRAPVFSGGEPAGVVAFLSRMPDQYDRADVARVERIAAHVSIAISHQRFAERDLRRADKAAADDGVSEQLLRTISGALDVRQVFPAISEAASRILPHDRLTMTFHDARGNIVVQAASNDDFPAVGLVTVDESGIHALDRPFFIADDMARTPLPIVTPGDLQDRLVALGYRSLLRVHLRARDERMGLAFWSKRAGAYTSADVAAARRVADHVALAVSHEQLAEAARQVAEARARAERLDARVKSLTVELDARRGRVLGDSPEWREVLKAAVRVSATDTTVLLNGESGTGKEVIARMIHRASPRKDGPFVALNCAALPEQLLESELFGHERGAFTGATHPKPGQIELASGGVLLLDEVTEMSLTAQSKFLRVLQEREYVRLGGTRSQTADVRVIAATNRDLRKAVERGAFREDLYYRLMVFDIRLPPLRDRRSDILPLSDAFLEEIARDMGRPPGGLTRAATQALGEYSWPGNVRELRNVLERAAILCEGALITVEHLSLPADGQAVGSASPTADLRVIEQRAIADMLQQVHGNKSEAARRLGLSRTQLYVRMRKYRIDTN